MLFKAINPHVEVNGETVLSLINGMGFAKVAGKSILSNNGIDDPKPGQWYKQQSWLNAFKEISEKIGDATLKAIGKSIPETAQFPTEIDSIEKALFSIDIAYHMNHRLDGKPLFDPATGIITEGIGHYIAEKKTDTLITIICDNPYPDAFDLGLIDTMAKKFPGNAAHFIKVQQLTETVSRTKGDNTSVFEISWTL
jgi:hypothetical protein